MGSGSRGSGGPFITTTTVTSVLDLSTGVTKTFHSSNNPSNSGGGEMRSSLYPFGSYGGHGVQRKMTEGETNPLFNVLSENDVNVLVESWNVLKKRTDFAPKVFLRYNFLSVTRLKKSN